MEGKEKGGTGKKGERPGLLHKTHYSTFLGICHRPSRAVGARLARASCDLCESDLLDSRSPRGYSEWTPGREGVPRETDEPSKRGRKKGGREGGGEGGREVGRGEGVEREGGRKGRKDGWREITCGLIFYNLIDYLHPSHSTPPPHPPLLPSSHSFQTLWSW